MSAVVYQVAELTRCHSWACATGPKQDMRKALRRGLNRRTLSIVHDTGGLHDTVDPLRAEENTGNGFLFEFYDSTGLRWAMSEAIEFYARPAEDRAAQIARIMKEAAVRFDHATTADTYMRLYDEILARHA